MLQEIDPDLVNTAIKLLGCSSLSVLAFHRNRMNHVTSLGADAVFFFFAFSLMDHSDVINRPLWSDALVLSMAILALVLAAIDVIKWAARKRVHTSSATRPTVRFGLNAK